MAHEDVWHVQLPTGEVRMMTLDDLDAAFNDGLVDEHVYVRRDGAMQWRTLSEELAASDAPSATPAPVVTYQPVQPLYSTAPMVSEIDDAELEALRPKSNKGRFAILGAVALAAVALVSVGVTKLGGSGAAAAAAGAAVNVAPVAAPVAAPEEVKAAVNANNNAPKLNVDQKKALLDQDNALKQKQDQRRKTRVNNAPPPVPHKSQLSKGTNNQYDPLNTKI